MDSSVFGSLDSSNDNEDYTSSSSSDLNVFVKARGTKLKNEGSKKARLECLWKRKSSKIKKDHGKEYVGVTGKLNAGKSFKSVEKCCLKNCMHVISNYQQKRLFESFWKNGDKNVQDNLIASYLKPCEPKRRVQNNKKYKERQYSWKYEIQIDTLCHPVCRNFFLSLFQISAKRVRVIQQKIGNGVLIMKDNRGTHENRPHKIQENVWEHFEQHLRSLPHSNSHYSLKKTKKLYFDNPNLNVKILYNLFKEYYFEKTGQILTINYKTYHRHFRTNSKYAFRRPRTDVCNFCYKCEVILKQEPDHSCKPKYLQHKQQVSEYKALKSSILENCRSDKSTLVLEFDFAQNRPLPKLHVNAQFYKRLLWFYIFNVHCHNDNNSYIYWFLESEGDRNSNSVCSLLYDCISRLSGDEVKKIVLFSDSTSAQNKSRYVSHFLSWLSKAMSVQIDHIYPVVGHSYNICDSNCGQFSQKMTKVEVIETPGEYEQIISNTRRSPSPFHVIHSACLLKNWCSMFKHYVFETPKSLKFKWTIRKYAVMKYMAGYCVVSPSYKGPWQPFKVVKTGGKFEEVSSFMPSVNPPANKMKDLLSLQPYLSEDGKKWFNDNVFNK